MTPVLLTEANRSRQRPTRGSLAILRLHVAITNIKVCAAATTDRRLVFNLQVAVLSVVIEERRVDEGFRSFPLHMGANVISGELM